MSVTTKFTEDDSVVVISVTGKFDFSLLNDFRKAYSDDAVAFKKVVLDMRATTTLDSSALGMLLNMQRHLGKKDGEIRIINCNMAVMKIFRISHFDQKFTIE